MPKIHFKNMVDKHYL